MEIIDEKNISTKDRKMIKLVIGIPFVFFIGFVAHSFFSMRDVILIKREHHLEKKFSGYVEKLFRDTRNHNVRIAVLKNGYKYALPGKWENLVNVGDSLDKKQNSLVLNIYRLGEVVYTLDYNDTYRK